MYNLIKNDMLANYARNTSWLELVRLYVTNPDFKTVFHYRIYSCLYPRKGITRILARMLYVHTVRISACYISPYAVIGPGFRLMHATGIVIGNGVRIGKNATIYQHVTLGQRRGTEEQYPRLKDGVAVYAGACVLGGITVGENAQIGANAVVLADVPDNAVVIGMPARVLEKKERRNEMLLNLQQPAQPAVGQEK